MIGKAGRQKVPSSWPSAMNPRFCQVCKVDALANGVNASVAEQNVHDARMMAAGSRPHIVIVLYARGARKIVARLGSLWQEDEPQVLPYNWSELGLLGVSCRYRG